jgi:phytoene desaturase
MHSTTDLKGRTIIVGGGVGGLSAAIHLAAAGMDVTILERQDSIGGKLRQVTDNGYRWDTGPTVITLNHVFADLFAAAGRRVEDYLTLVPVDPLTRYVYPDGATLDINVSLAQTIANISALEPRDVAGYIRFLAFAANMYRITAPFAMYGDPPAPRDLFDLPLSDIAQVDFARNMNQAIEAHVASPYLRQLLDRFATYLGASPYKARGYMNVIAHVELTSGLYYPLGGTHAIVRAYRRLGEELGVEICTGADVRRILIDHDTAVGVQLADGTKERADVVVANVDATTVYQDLLPEMQDSRRLRRWKAKPFSCSGFVLFLGVDKRHPQLAHHNIFFSSDYRHEFSAIFDRGVPSQEPTVYVAITAKTDPAHAPDGCENWFVMTNVPPTGSKWDWEKEALGYRDLILERLAQFGIDVRQCIQTEQMLTPLDIQHLTGAWRGALYGHSFNNPLASFQRPHNRCPDIDRLYFAGGTTHPGGGVPLVTLSGGTAARLIARDLGGQSR